ncbi:hypothetical protein EDC40_102459 [Aminobacter aminovorans]|uniref:Uncharacterized protein n=1 Tax=Aminobacter aminovorans TaxID=83263 RepID=A0A380WJD3_AMIAI|nr:DUF6665 family protein [Aminobacter aminovorans]TCS29015.1 hypothetical protein EDC40_102459 [Aminobacter aminovorans]SUU88868.1 Uncharacterised protein [Aminobacter aminovorans]
MSSVRPPSILSNRSEQTLNVLEYEFLAEKAAALGRAGERVGEALGKLNLHQGDAEQRRALVKAAADAVYVYFIQRELCGLRKHDDAIRDYAIPREVLVRLGAS